MLNDLFITEIGAGKVHRDSGQFTLSVPPAAKSTYHDAQISTYRTRRDFHHQPPVRMTVRAYATGTPLVGTAGFGFWNHAFMPGERSFRLPKAVWYFFASPPSDMALAKGVPGHGWKASTFDATRWPFFALLPTAPLAFLLMRIPALYNILWPLGQRAIGVSEHLLDVSLLETPHTYSLDWQANRVTFAVDGLTVHEAPVSISGPLGFIAWLDNQYAVVTPQGRFGAGLLDVPHEQALVVEDVAID